MRAGLAEVVGRRRLRVSGQPPLVCRSPPRPTSLHFTTAIEVMGDRLFAYDRRIVVNTVRATLAPWQDRLTAVIGLLIGILGVRASLVDRPLREATWAVVAAAGMVGVTAGRLIASRLAFHAFDGVLAVDALRVPTRQRYMCAWSAIALAALAIVTLVARPSLMLVSLPAYVAGALVGGGMLGFGVSERAMSTPQYRRTITSWARRPSAGIVSATIVFVSLTLVANVLGTDAITAVAGIEATILAAALTVVDPRIVRFLTIAGQGSWRILARQARGAMLFIVLAPLSCALALDVRVAGIVATVSTAAVLLMTMRILAYRLHGQGFADVLVSMLVALLVLVAFSLPLMLPLVVIAMLWQLQRHAATKTWMLE